MLGELCERITLAARRIIDEQLREQIDEGVTAARELGRRRNDLVHGWIRVGIDGADAIVGRASKRSPEPTITKVTFDEVLALTADLEAARVATLILTEEIAAHLASTQET